MNNYLKESKTAIITFPVLFGWIFGILKYPVNSNQFAISLHTGVLTVFFLLIYGFLNTLNIFFEFPGDNPLIVTQSILSLIFITMSFLNYYQARRGNFVPGQKFTQSLLDRLFSIQN
jgi:hypothetical protein